MTLQHVLKQRRAEILDKWQALLIDSYPAETRRFLRAEKDGFANPVGARFGPALEKVLDGFLDDRDSSLWEDSLDDILRVRAVQDFSPSEAVGFLLGLKAVVRGALEKWGENTAPEELPAFEGRVDRMVLLAFDVYSRCRQELYDLRVKEVSRRTERLVRRAGLVAEDPEGVPGPVDTA